MTKPTAEYIRSILDYDPETGVFRWKHRTDVSSKGGWNRKYAGKITGCLDKSTGYVVIIINYKKYYAHILAWVFVTGEWPDNEIDHKDKVRSNNIFLNLRPATNSQQRMNSKLRSDNTSGIKGVSWRKDTKKWCVQIWVNNKKYNKGSYSTIEEAKAVYEEAAKQFHGEFASSN